MMNFYFSKTEVLTRMLCSYLNSRKKTIDEGHCAKMLEAVQVNMRNNIRHHALRDEMFRDDEFSITNLHEVEIHVEGADDLAIRWISETNKWKISCDPIDDIAILLVLVRLEEDDPQIATIEFEQGRSSDKVYDRPGRALARRLLEEDREKTDHRTWIQEHGLPVEFRPHVL